MDEQLLYILEESNKKMIESIIKEESFCEKIEEEGLELHIMRMKDTGAFGIFLNKVEGTFSRNELLVMKGYLSGVKREFDISRKERIGVVLDKQYDIKQFSEFVMHYSYNNTY